MACHELFPTGFARETFPVSGFARMSGLAVSTSLRTRTSGSYAPVTSETLQRGALAVDIREGKD